MRAFLSTLLLGPLLGAALCAQEPELAAFRALPAAAQTTIVQAAEGRLQRDDAPALQRIRALAATATALPTLPPRAHFEPKEFAPVAPARTRIAAGSAQQTAQRQRFPSPPFLRRLHPQVVYDWGLGKAARGPAPTAVDRFDALLAGFAPGCDAAIALLLQTFDTDDEQRAVADWLAHLYADRDGHVFDGITLYEAWYSGQTVEVPDVDAIAFARRVLHTDSFVSPIPDGRRRDRLYRQIHDAFARHREYRTLREAAAAAFIAAEPDLDPTYGPLAERLLFLWPRLGNDPARVAQKLGAGDRQELVAALDEALGGGAEVVALRDQARAELRAAQERVRTIAREELQKATGAGK